MIASLRTCFLSITLTILSILLVACGGGNSSQESENGLTKIVLQTDWYAQPEHGGFYQALAQGYYEEVGLDVEIIPGGPNALPVQKVAQGVADFAIGRSDEVIIAASRQVPVAIAGALMQHDPQAVLFHKESGITKFEDLDGKTIMANPGSAFIRIMEQTYDIDVNIMPLDYGMNRFLADKNFIQQCFITNEPYYVEKEGADAGTLLLSDSGFSPYRVWFTSRGFARAKPDIIKAFTEASIRGWNDYLTGDRTDANAMISANNPQQTPELMDYVANSMIENKLVSGRPENGEKTGLVTTERIQKQIEQLTEIEMLESEVKVEDVLIEGTIDLSQATPSYIKPQHWPNLVLHTSNGIQQSQQVIKPAQMAEIAVEARRKFFETADEHYDMQIVYLADFIETFVSDPELTFWITNYGDKYQSNFTPDILNTVKPYFILTIDGQSIVDWLDSIDHPEWGPHVLNIESTEGLLDPPHKNPWGVSKIHAVTKELAFSGLGSSELGESAEKGQLIFANSCASCHQTGNGLLGGSVSSRTMPMLAAFAINAEDYFRKMLISPKETNPLAEKMPSYAHYQEEHIVSLIDFLKTVAIN